MVIREVDVLWLEAFDTHEGRVDDAAIPGKQHGPVVPESAPRAHIPLPPAKQDHEFFAAQLHVIDGHTGKA